MISAVLLGAVISCLSGAAPLSAPSPAPPASSPGTAATPPTRTVIRVVVTDLGRSDDVAERLGQIVADNLVAELRKLVGVSVVSMDEVRAMLALEGDRQAIGCDDSSSCLSELADALGADVVIGGSIATLDGARIFSLRRIDQRRAAVTGQVEERLVLAGGEELLAAIGPAIEKLFPDTPVKSGLVRGVPGERARLLNPPPLPVWSTFAVGAVATATMLGGGGALLLANAALGDGQDLVNASTQRPVDGALVVKQERAAGEFTVLGVSLLVGGAVVAAGTGVMALFTDWRDARGQGTAE
jgi:hypothetical protein